MPSLGADMEAGTLVEWLVKPGDWVKRGDIVAVVETQKGAIEIETFQVGQIEKFLVDLNTEVPVGTPIALIRTEGAEVAAAAASASACRPVHRRYAAARATHRAAANPSRRTRAATGCPQHRRSAMQLHRPPGASPNSMALIFRRLTGSGPDGAITPSTSNAISAWPRQP